MTYRQKFEEEEKEKNEREQVFEKKRKLNELLQEQREKRNAIKDTFKSIMIDGKIEKAEDEENKIQGKSLVQSNLWTHEHCITPHLYRRRNS